ncbi:M1 family metallopeptidase [Pseudenhygromyxa sp. WMMC2535]|uniref:M1 family metallopeptidase n=1 Tax=Pseudenhygromyxa sp. WMMC2535 TaxID=2712867 RepID=UPI0015549783|nr:M1 family metallopeptidase [Pseudenhygromyxa sp. WMMC2535]NVB40374.1 M1 family metallopeptidase [Pseudenhygromyxa sp. WMMC2535]
MHARPWASLALASLFWASLAACDDDGADAPPVEAPPEPEQGLRPAQQRGVVPEDARVVDTRITARLDERAHEIHGQLRVLWRNRTQRSVETLPFHLYMNGFRAEDTAWMAEARGEHRGRKIARDGWGFIEVSRVGLLAHEGSEASASIDLEHDPGGGAKALALAFAEDADPSTMTVTLDAPVGPGEAVLLELDFRTHLPRVFARTGYAGSFHMAGQWFPKLGVLEDEAGWQAHTFGLYSEFYADFGDYEVVLDVPADYTVGATGVRVGETASEDGARKQLRYRAQMVHDFAWAADPNFVERWGEYEGIRIRQLLQPDHLDSAQAHLDAQLAALASMEARFGPYPWSTITIVHPPASAKGAQGMEYPTLYTTSDVAESDWIPEAVLRERLTGVFTTIHEYGHQYFQGLFASNEHAQPWLDEGMNTAANQLVYWDAYGEDPWTLELLGLPFTTKDLLSLSMLQAERDTIDQPASSWDPLVESYGVDTYQKTAALMLTLRELVGREPWDRAMARYAEQARFRHPTGAQLEGILVDEIGGEDGRFVVAAAGPWQPEAVALDVQALLDQGLREASVADYRLLAVGNRRRLGDAGWHRIEASAADGAEQLEALAMPAMPWPFSTSAKSEPPPGLALTPTPGNWGRSPAKLPEEAVEGYVIVQRRSSLRLPVEVLVEFTDGETVTVAWDGQAAHHRFDFPGRRVRRASLDPDYRLLLDPRRLDNAAAAQNSGEDQPDDALATWVGDIAEAADLAALGALGI